MSQSYRPEPMRVPDAADGTEQWIITEGGYVLTDFDGALLFPSKAACEAEIAAREKRGLVLAAMFKHAKVEVRPGPPPKP